MPGFLLSLLVVLQANPTGVVTGIVRNNMGMPAAGVRVYAMAVRESNDGGNTGTVLESISQTDESGRYRLEIPAGRYYIAAGSLETPTYFPGTSDVAGARVISITSTSVIDAIDFSGFVPAVRAPTPGVFAPPPGSTGVLSGVIQFPDGTPAVGIPVTVAPVNVVNATSSGTSFVTSFVQRIATAPSGAGGTVPTIICLNSVSRPTPSAGGAVSVTIVAMTSCLSGAWTDNTGRYRITNVSPGTYYVVAGFSNSPTFYPSSADVAAATVITTTPTTNLDTLDFTMPVPSKGITVRGRVIAAESVPAGGATVELRGRNTLLMAGLSLLPSRPNQQATSGADGSFEISGVLPGTYMIEARLSGALPITRSLVVTDQPVNDIEFAFPISVLSGQVLLEDGSAFPEAQSLREVAVVTVTSPYKVVTTILPIDSSGKFSRVLEAGEYRFYVRVLPNEYTIKSMTSGGTDLLKETLSVDGTSPVRVELRMAKRTESTGLKVRGRVVDSITGKPSSAERIELCCLADSPFESLSTRLDPDGSFEFSAVPPGRYAADLSARRTLVLTEHSIEVADQDVSGITLASASQLISVPAQLNVEGGSLPTRSRVLLVLTGTSEVPIPAEFRDGIATVWVAGGDRYRVTVSNLPSGYVVKSIMSGGSDLLNDGRISISMQPVPVAPPIVVTLVRSP